MYIIIIMPLSVATESHTDRSPLSNSAFTNTLQLLFEVLGILSSYKGQNTERKRKAVGGGVYAMMPDVNITFSWLSSKEEDPQYKKLCQRKVLYSLS